MFSGRFRWTQVALFVVLALVPTISVGILGWSALASAEVAALREVAALVAAGRDRTEASVDRAMTSAETALARVADSPSIQDVFASVRAAAPPFGEGFVFDEGQDLVFPERDDLPSSQADPACEAARAALAADGDPEAKRAARATILARCPQIRSASGRFLFPALAVLAIRDGEDHAAALRAWIDRYAASAARVERLAIRADVEALSGVDPAWKRDVSALLSAPRSRREDTIAALDGAEVRAAIAAAKPNGPPIAFRDASARGFVRRLASGRAIGVVVHAASVADALPREPFDLPPVLFAELVEPGRERQPSAQSPAAFVEISPRLVLRIAPRDPGIVRRQAKKNRLVLGGVGAGSIIVACALSLLVFLRVRRTERSSDLRTDFVSAVSHELRTPIASVRMLAELLDQGRVPEDERREIVEALTREAVRLSDTVNRLLAWSRMDAGRAVAHKRRGRVADPVLAAIATFERRHPEGPKIEADLDRDRFAEIDAAEVELAVDNLLANAKKYAPEGGPYVVRLESEGEREGGGGARISVRDRGPGIPKKLHKRIFEPFERADDRLSQAVSGSGIGLSLVAHVARAHEGRAWVESEPGKGATFFLWIPEKSS